MPGALSVSALAPVNQTVPRMSMGSYPQCSAKRDAAALGASVLPRWWCISRP
ncbi:hypothetical protein [Streptomyces antimycoticus]|uniref:hypothetical protein n=1 Tax=Streptomyces antimycoticus TaxID=68175 RepID=UPI0013870759|nr:hypothetical protein [Streptomyces antimycoticus]